MPFHRLNCFEGRSTYRRHRFATKEGVVTVVWNDLTPEEQIALKRLNRWPYPAISEALAERLVFLGLAEERPNGRGINRAGRALVINTLVKVRSD
jgi:hypothetical protein